MISITRRLCAVAALCLAAVPVVPAAAKITGNTVLVSSPELGAPNAVCYACGNTSFVNLFGKNGLPVGLFRTDAVELPEKNP